MCDRGCVEANGVGLFLGVSNDVLVDPTTLSVVALVVLGAGLLACWIPARRATRVDPIVALRYE